MEIKEKKALSMQFVEKGAPGIVGKRVPGMKFVVKRSPGMEFVDKRSPINIIC